MNEEYEKNIHKKIVATSAAVAMAYTQYTLIQ